MSGDVQPRKRRDKKRKKDDAAEQSQIPYTSSSSGSDDVTIHVHKEIGTGGGICAKVVFFILFSVLALLIGLILTEHRGLTDLETSDQESRFSQLFEGWIDSKPAEEEHDVIESVEDHLDEEDEDPLDEQSQESQEKEEEEPDEEEEEEEVQQSEEEEQEQSEEQQEEEEDLENTLSNESEEPNVSIEQEENNDEDNEDEAEKEEEYENDEEDGNEEAPPDDENEEIVEVITGADSNYRMVVKIGVGVALLVVAHVVLVKKWKSAPASKSEAPPSQLPLDLSRRNTIVVPPELQQVEQDIEEDDEEYSDEDGEVESDDERHISAKTKYQQLRSTYTRSLTPESEPERANIEESDQDDEEVEEEEEEESEEEDQDDDEELLQRLEARYGKIAAGKSAGVPKNEAELSDQSDEYEYENITNQDDWKIKEKLDEAQNVINDSAASAIKLFDVLLQHNPESPRSLYGKAQCFDNMAEKERSNELLQKTIESYANILEVDNVPDELFRKVALRTIDRIHFSGNYKRAIPIHRKLISRFPDPKYKNALAVTLLIMNEIELARSVILEILSQHPDDGLALVHYGFILKTADKKVKESVEYLRKGIQTKHAGVIDGRFFFHLGDALTRLGRNNEALDVFEEGVKYKLFPSKYQRSLYNVNRLSAKPWWKKEDTPYDKLYESLENNWQKIRNEALSIIGQDGMFQNENENLKDTGDWKQFELFARGRKNTRNCAKCPLTCKIIERFPEAKGCKRGQTKFSVIHPGTHVWPHCGPTNCRLRTHLGLNVPPGTFIRVAEETRSWENGKIFIFDDSFEHEVWHNGTTFRLVLIIDVWHPELTKEEIGTLSPI